MKNLFCVFFVFLLTKSFAFAEGFTQEDRALLKKLNENYLVLEERFNGLEKQMDIRFDAQDKRLDQQNKRLGDIWSLMLVLVAGIFGSVAYMYWDRREANRPLKEKIEMQEKELSQHKQEIEKLNAFVQQLMNKAAAL